MSDPAVWLGNVSPTYTYGIAVGVIAFFVILWIVARIGRVPPALKTVGSDGGWILTPLDRVDEASRAGRIEPVVREVQGYLAGVLRSRYGVAPTRPGRARTAVPPELRSAGRHLDSASRYARRLEVTEMPDFVRNWFRRGWSQRAREDLDRALAEIERGLATPEVPRDRA